MRRIALLAVLLMATTAPAIAQSELAQRVPAGPLVYVEAADLRSLLAAMQEAPAMRAWYATAGYDAFRNTKLALKLSSRFREMEGLVGAGFNLANLTTIAGRESALAIYDIGRLQILYVSRLDPARFAASALAPLRQKFDARTDAGLTYFARTREDGAIEFAFAQTGEWLFASTDVALLERAAAGVPRAPGAKSLADDAAFRRADAMLPSGPVPASPDLRIHLDQARLNRDGYFRAYWIGRNAGDLSWIGAAQTAVHFDARGVEERRVYLPSAEASAARTPAAAGSPPGDVRTATPDVVSLAPSLPATLAAVSWTVSPTADRILDALFRDVLGRDRPADSKEPSALLSRELAEWLSRAPVDSVGRAAAPAAGGGGQADWRGAVVLRSGTPGLLTTGAVEPALRRWASLELTGEPAHAAVGFSGARGVRSLVYPFTGGRGLHLVAAAAGLVLASDADLALALAAVEPPRGVLACSRLDLAVCRAGLRELVWRATGPRDSLRTHFGDGWLGLLDSLSRVRAVTEWSWPEGDAVRQVERFEYAPAK